VSSDIRAALRRLVELSDVDGAWGLHWDDAIAAARAALAEPVGEAEVNLELMAALIEIQRLRDLRQPPAAPPAPEPVGERAINWPAYFLRVADKQAREIEEMLRQAPPGRVEPLPAAQAALDAYETTHGVSPGLAAAFLAVAGQVVPDQRGDGVYLRGADYHRWLERKIIRRQILAIAAELEGFNV
jgi:hypothetical protein